MRFREYHSGSAYGIGLPKDTAGLDILEHQEHSLMDEIMVQCYKKQENIRQIQMHAST